MTHRRKKLLLLLILLSVVAICLWYLFKKKVVKESYSPRRSSKRVIDDRALFNTVTPEIIRKSLGKKTRTKSLNTVLYNKVGQWTSISGYDVTSSDNGPSGKYMTPEFKLNKRFLENVPICAVHQKDWEKYKYHYLLVSVLHPTTKQVKSSVVYVMDFCKDSDCDEKDMNCCTKNANEFGFNFVIDLEKTSCQKKFGFDPLKNLLVGKWLTLWKMDPSYFIGKYGIKRS